MKKILAVFMICIMLEVPFVFAEEISIQEENVFSSIYKDENIEDNVTREQLFALIASTLDLDTATDVDKTFADMNEVDEDLAPYVLATVNANIVSGAVRNGEYYLLPKDEITKQEACVVIAKALNINSTVPAEYSDVIFNWAETYISAVSRAGIFTGYDDGSFKPESPIKISEILKVLDLVKVKKDMNRGTLTIYAGTGNATLEDEELVKASFNNPTGIAVFDEKIYVADTDNNCIREIDDCNVITVAGSAENFDFYNNAIGSFKDGKAGEALLNAPMFMTTGLKGVLFTDSQNNFIRYYSNGRVTTYAGVIYGGYLNGRRTQARFSNPTGIVSDAKGNVYIADTNNNVIRKIDRSDKVTIYAGSDDRIAGYRDGIARNALFNRPMGLALKDGILYIADCGNQRIRKIEDGMVTTVAGSGTDLYDGTNEIIGDFIDGSKENACFNFPKNVVIDENDNLYVADSGNSAIRKIDKDGNVYTIIGFEKISGNDEIKLVEPTGLLIKDGNLYITDSAMNTIYIYNLEVEE